MCDTKRIVQFENETWNLISTGVTRDDGMTYCHLTHPTKGKQQKNGFVPLQMGVWVDLATAEWKDWEASDDRNA